MVVSTTDRMVKVYMRKSLGKRMLKRSSSPAPTPGLPSDPGSGEDYDFVQSLPPLATAWAAWNQAVGAMGANLLSQQARLAIGREPPRPARRPSSWKMVTIVVICTNVKATEIA